MKHQKPKLISIGLLFEPVDSCEIPAEDIIEFHFAGISHDLDFEPYEDISQTTTVKDVQIVVDYDKLNCIDSTQSLSGDIDNAPMGMADRIKEYNDITSINVIYQDSHGQRQVHTIDPPYNEDEDDSHNKLQHSFVKKEKDFINNQEINTLVIEINEN